MVLLSPPESVVRLNPYAYATFKERILGKQTLINRYLVYRQGECLYLWGVWLWTIVARKLEAEMSFSNNRGLWRQLRKEITHWRQRLRNAPFFSTGATYTDRWLDIVLIWSSFFCWAASLLDEDSLLEGIDNSIQNNLIEWDTRDRVRNEYLCRTHFDYESCTCH